MCLVAFKIFQQNGKYGSLICANRDEFFARPTQSLHHWGNGVVAGKDLEAGGTWMGLNENGRVAFLTNFRDLSNIKADAISRGDLVRGFLENSESPENFLHSIQERKEMYNGFNLVLGWQKGYWFYSNEENVIKKLEPGVFGLSNGLLDEPWPKVERVRERFSGLLENGASSTEYFEMMKDAEVFPDNSLPDTGVGIELERSLSSVFIRREGYGSRLTSLMEVAPSGLYRFWERTYDFPGNTIGTKYFYSEGSSKDLSASTIPS